MGCLSSKAAAQPQRPPSPAHSDHAAIPTNPFVVLIKELVEADRWSSSWQGSSNVEGTMQLHAPAPLPLGSPPVQLGPLEAVLAKEDSGGAAAARGVAIAGSPPLIRRWQKNTSRCARRNGSGANGALCARRH